jgi:hypothetical protein
MMQTTISSETSTLDQIMHLARDKTVQCIFLGSFLWVAAYANAVDLTLDLTEQRPADDILPTVGIVMASGEGGPSAKPMKLPLEVTIQDLSPLTPAVTKDEIHLQLLVRNVGKEPLAIPASKHYSEIMKSGNLDRSIMSLGLEFTLGGGNGPVSKETIKEFLTVAVGSSSLPGSMLVIGPGQSVLVYATERLWRTQEWDTNVAPAYSRRPSERFYGNNS